MLGEVGKRTLDPHTDQEGAETPPKMGAVIKKKHEAQHP